MPNYKLGMNATAHLAAALFTAADAAAVTGATLTELTQVRDVTLNLTKATADVSTRGNNGWRATAATLKEASVDFEIVAKAGDAGVEAIRNAFMNNTEIPLVFVDDAIAIEDAEGPAGNWEVSQFNRTEALEDAVKYQVTVTFSSFQQWYVAPAPPP